MSNPCKGTLNQNKMKKAISKLFGQYNIKETEEKVTIIEYLFIEGLRVKKSAIHDLLREKFNTEGEVTHNILDRLKDKNAVKFEIEAKGHYVKMMPEFQIKLIRFFGVNKTRVVVKNIEETLIKLREEGGDKWNIISEEAKEIFGNMKEKTTRFIEGIKEKTKKFSNKREK